MAIGSIDPEDPLAIPAAPIVEWYRFDASRRIAKILIIAATGMAMGAVAIARLSVSTSPYLWGRPSAARMPVLFGFATFSDPNFWVGSFGLLLVTLAGLVAVLGLQRVLSEENYLALRVDGALFQCGEARRFWSWADTQEIVHDPARGVVLISSSGEEWTISQRFAGVDHRELAKRAAAVRRRALFGLYPSQRPPT